MIGLSLVRDIGGVQSQYIIHLRITVGYPILNEAKKNEQIILAESQQERLSNIPLKICIVLSKIMMESSVLDDDLIPMSHILMRRVERLSRRHDMMILSSKVSIQNITILITNRARIQIIIIHRSYFIASSNRCSKESMKNMSERSNG